VKSHILKNSKVWALVPDLLFEKNKEIREIDLGAFKAPYRISAITRAERRPSRLVSLLIENFEKSLSLTSRF
jgi:hypothetical protein